MTGYTDDTLVKYGVRDGQFPLLNKPFTSEALIAKVQAVLSAPPPSQVVAKDDP
jgi:hypothetical protein